MELTYEQLKELAGKGANIHVHLGGGTDGETPPDNGGDPPPSTVVYGKGNGVKNQLKLWTPFNHNGVLQENKSEPPRLIMIEAENIGGGENLTILNSDEFIIHNHKEGGVYNADSGSKYKAYWGITKFRNEDKYGLLHLRYDARYSAIKPMFWVPKELVELVQK